MSARTFALAAAFAVAAVISAPAQDAADPFDTSAFDQASTAGAASAQAAATEVLFGGSIVVDDTARAGTSGDTPLDWYTLQGTISGRVFGKVTVPDYGSVYVGYVVSHLLYQGVGGTLPAGSAAYLSAPAGSLWKPSATLSELYWSFDLGKVVFLRVGNQLVAWGPSAVWTPVDFINIQKADPLASFDRRAGKPGLRVHLPLDGANLFAFADLSGTVTQAGVRDPLETAVLSVRGDLTVAGVELALTGSAGASVPTRAGFDFSGRLLGFDVYGETAAVLADGTHDFSWAASAGFQRTLGDLGYWSLAGEFFYNSAGTADTAAYPGMLMAGTFVPLYVGQYYAWASLSRSHVGVVGISASLSGLANLSDLSWQVRAGLTVSVPRLVPFTLSASYSGGGDGKELTLAAGDGALSLGLQARFEF